jgi:hypothetical protein
LNIASFFPAHWGVGGSLTCPLSLTTTFDPMNLTIPFQWLYFLHNKREESCR